MVSWLVGWIKKHSLHCSFPVSRACFFDQITQNNKDFSVSFVPYTILSLSILLFNWFEFFPSVSMLVSLLTRKGWDIWYGNMANNDIWFLFLSLCFTKFADGEGFKT